MGSRWYSSVVLFLSSLSSSDGLVVPVVDPSSAHTSTPPLPTLHRSSSTDSANSVIRNSDAFRSSPLSSSSPVWLSAVVDDTSTIIDQKLPTYSLDNLNTIEKDVVVRILDANTVKLEKGGLITFAAAKTPTGYNQNELAFPECMSKSPSWKVRKLLPKGSKIGVRYVDNKAGSTASRPREALVVITRDGKKELVNAELVRSGYARPLGRGRDAIEKILPGLADELQILQAEAKEKGLGLYIRCDDELKEDDISLDEQFEPMDFTVETKFGDDGGKQVIVKRETPQQKP